jgi:putative OPT family oligopeptide transporter
MIATLGVFSIVCCASATSNDIAQDLKTGKIVGASPYKQQAMQILGVIIASIIIPPILELLHNETPGGIGGKELSAPQAGLFSSMIQGVFGNSIIPWNLVGIGALVAIVIYIIDLYLESHGSEIRLYIMPIAIGVYLPLGLSIPMVLGAIIAYIMSKKSIFEKEEKLKGGTLFASGAIAGEALMGVGIAGLAAFGVPRIKLVNSSILLNIITFGFLLVIIISLILSTRSKKRN